jgi:hypothetical protein
MPPPGAEAAVAAAAAEDLIQGLGICRLKQALASLFRSPLQVYLVMPNIKMMSRSPPHPASPAPPVL